MATPDYTRTGLMKFWRLTLFAPEHVSPWLNMGTAYCDVSSEQVENQQEAIARFREFHPDLHPAVVVAHSSCDYGIPPGQDEPAGVRYAHRIETKPYRR